MKTANRRVDEDAHQADAHPTGTDLAQHHLQHRHHPADRGEAVVHAVDGAVRRAGRGTGPQPARRSAEADLLALEVAADELRRAALIDSERREVRISADSASIVKTVIARRTATITASSTRACRCEPISTP